MHKPPFQFRLKSLFAITTAAAVLMAIAASLSARSATAFGTLLAACLLSGIAALAFGYVAATILYLAFLLTVLLFEPAVRRPTLVQFKLAARMLAISAVLLAAEFALLCLFID